MELLRNLNELTAFVIQTKKILNFLLPRAISYQRNAVIFNGDRHHAHHVAVGSMSLSARKVVNL